MEIFHNMSIKRRNLTYLIPMYFRNEKVYLSDFEVRDIIRRFNINMRTYKLIIVGVRDDIDYRKWGDSFYVVSSRGVTVFDGSTRPINGRSWKHVYSLVADTVYYSYKLDKRKVRLGPDGPYPSLCQRFGDVRIYRPGTENAKLGRAKIKKYFLDKQGWHKGNGIWEGMFDLDFIRDGKNPMRNSYGEQVIFRPQFQTFISLIEMQLKILYSQKGFETHIVPYILMNRSTIEGFKEEDLIV